MTLQELKNQFGIKSIEFEQFKVGGSFMATIINPANNASIKLFSVKKDGDTFDVNSPIRIIDGKFFVGTMPAPIARKTC